MKANRNTIQIVGVQRLTGIGSAGAAMLVLPALFSVFIAFQQSAAWESYERTMRVNAVIARQGGNAIVESAPTGLPITVWAVMGVVSLVGAILLLVGRETVFSGSVDN